jgi:hypothetical protein
VVVLWQSGAVSLFTSDLETGSAALYNAQLPDGRTLTFRLEEGRISDDQTNSTWNIFGQAIEGELVGVTLERRFAYPHFWFAWQAFRPNTLIWEAGLIADEAWSQ